MEFEERFFKRCIEARKLAGYSQSDVARLAGVTRQAVQKFEKGKVKTSKLIFVYMKIINELLG